MSPGATFERVYLAIKQELGSGRLRPGDRLEPAALSDGLHASVTPIRDALHRLVGERLVQAPFNNGFRVPLLTEAALRDLYAWNCQLLLLACRGGTARQRPVMGADPSGRADEDGDPGLGAARLFLAIAGLSQSMEHVTAVAGMNDRLRPARRAEAALLADWAAELADLRRSMEAGDLAHVRRLLGTYHRRRQKAVPELLALLQPRL